MFREADPNTIREMDDLAQKEYRHDIQWGLVHPGNAICQAIFRTKKEALDFKKRTGTGYVVVKVVIQPMYDLSK